MKNCKINLTHLHGHDRAYMIHDICTKTGGAAGWNTGYIFIEDAALGWIPDGKSDALYFHQNLLPEVTPEAFLYDEKLKGVIEGKDLAAFRGKQLDSFEPTPDGRELTLEDMKRLNFLMAENSTYGKYQNVGHQHQAIDISHMVQPVAHVNAHLYVDYRRYAINEIKRAFTLCPTKQHHVIDDDPDDVPTTEHTIPAAALMIKDIPNR